MLRECYDHGEFRYLSLDATEKINMAILCQSHGREARHIRAAQAMPESESHHKVLTVRGISSAVLCLVPIRTEAAEPVTEGMSTSLAAPFMRGVEHIASDMPSLHMQTVLSRLCPCLLYTSPSPRDLSTSRMPSSA